ncbi:MAG: alpha-L-fucosidase [Acidobacteria bacterium]|nr:alpha-L-fucosidase [Acidobacteriota bacterium]
MKITALMLAGLLATAGMAGAQTYTPAPENLKAREWFQDARFGMFIHWGVYSVLEDGEWVMNNRKIPISEYEKLPPKFNPVKFNAAEWVALAKAAGMKYITITSKHHDGFAMFATKQSKWNIVDVTPYKRDPLKELAEECRKQGIKLFFYHSHLDWTHADYYPRGRTGQASGRAESGDFNKYLDFMDAQLTELLTNYGPIGGIWFDGWWDKRDANWRLEQTYRLIHKLQPAALVGNNHHVKPFEGEDFQMFEKDLPGKNTAGHSADSVIGNLPLETCDTINKAWGYNAKDKSLKSTKDLIQYVVRAAGYGANFLLNVGPKPDGTIQEEFTVRLKEIGQWMKTNGEAVYGTRGGPVGPRNWGVTTQTATKVYVHVLDWQDEMLAVPSLGKVKNARLLNGQKVEMAAAGSGVMFKLPAQRDALDTIIVLDKQ